MKAPPRNLIIARGLEGLGVGGTTKQESNLVYILLLTLVLLSSPTKTLETIFEVLATILVDRV